MTISSSTSYATQNLSGRPCMWRGATLLLGAMPMASARADSGWDGVGMLYFFGLLPLLILVGAFVISLFISRAPWLHKAWTGIVIAATVMALTIPMMSGAIDPPLYAIPLIWIIPALAWVAMSHRLKQRPGSGV